MTHQLPHSSCRQCMRLSGCLHAQRLMQAPVVVERDPITRHTHGMLQTLEPVPVHTLLLQSPGHALDHAVLLRAVGRDESLLQTVAAYQARVVRLANTSQLSRPPQMRHGSVARANPPWMGSASTRGLKPTDRLRTCPPFS